MPPLLVEDLANTKGGDGDGDRDVDCCWLGGKDVVETDSEEEERATSFAAVVCIGLRAADGEPAASLLMLRKDDVPLSALRSATD